MDEELLPDTEEAERECVRFLQITRCAFHPVSKEGKCFPFWKLNHCLEDVNIST